MKLEQIEVAEIPFASTTPDEAVSTVIAMCRARIGQPVRLANAYCVATAQVDPTYRDVIQGDGVTFPDGRPVVWLMQAAARLRQQPLRPGLVRGPTLFRGCLSALEAANMSCFFLGADNETLNRLLMEVRNDYPNLGIAGSYSPPFADYDSAFLEKCIDHIARTAPDLVWVGLGTPKQDLFAAEAAVRLGVPVIGVGAAFDFIAGTVAEAPRWLQGSGFEWLYRFASEPRRLWRRYTIGNFRFLRAALTSLPHAKVQADRREDSARRQ